MSRLALAAPVVLALVVAACGGGSAASTPAPSQGAAAATPAGPVRVEVTLSDKLTVTPSAMTIPAGVPVTFVVTNTGTILHEFVVGDDQAQADHEQEMKDAGGMTMATDEENAIGVEGGKTKELTMTFDQPGTTLAGCHVVGHYNAGMKATITIE